MAIYSDRFKTEYYQILKDQLDIEKISQQDILAVVTSFAELIQIMGPAAVEQVLTLKYNYQKQAKQYALWTTQWCNRIFGLSSVTFTLARRKVTTESEEDDFFQHMNSIKDGK